MTRPIPCNLPDIGIPTEAEKHRAHYLECARAAIALRIEAVNKSGNRKEAREWREYLEQLEREAP